MSVIRQAIQNNKTQWKYEKINSLFKTSLSFIIQ